VGTYHHATLLEEVVVVALEVLVGERLAEHVLPGLRHDLHRDAGDHRRQQRHESDDLAHRVDDLQRRASDQSGVETVLEGEPVLLRDSSGLERGAVGAREGAVEGGVDLRQGDDLRQAGVRWRGLS
jgi:hypothetical protein